MGKEGVEGKNSWLSLLSGRDGLKSVTFGRKVKGVTCDKLWQDAFFEDRAGHVLIDSTLTPRFPAVVPTDTKGLGKELCCFAPANGRLQ